MRNDAARLGLLLLWGMIIGIWRPLPLSAHAELIRAEPEPGAQLSQSPAAIRLTFSEPLQPGSAITLRRQDFSLVSDVSAIDPLTPEQMEATVPALAAAVYVVQWTAVTVDGHSLTGSYEFGVNEPAVAQSGRFSARWLAAITAIVLLMVGLIRKTGIRD